MLALRLDIAVFEGSGVVPQLRGLKNVAGIQSVSMGANGGAFTSLDPVADAIALLESANAVPSAIAMHPRTWATVRKLKDTTNAPLVAESPAVAAPRTLFGVPVYASAQLATNESQGTATTASSIYVYAAGEVVLVRRADAEIELDRSRLFDRDMSEMRGKLRADLIVPNPSAVVRIAGVTP